MMNVFKVLGIRGFQDIFDGTFVEPDSTAKLFSIDSKIDTLSREIQELSDDIEVYCKKRSRITALKTANDMEQITNRLISILDNNEDKYIDTLSVIDQMKMLENILPGKKKPPVVETITDKQGILKSITNQNLINKQSKANRFYDMIKNSIFSSCSDEDRRVLCLFNIFTEYHEYCYYQKALRIYYRTLLDGRNFVSGINSYRDKNIYALCPLYVSLLYLEIISQHIKKASKNISFSAIIKDEAMRKKIQPYISPHPSNFSVTKTSITCSEYFDLMTRNLVKQIIKILKQFDICKPPPQTELYFTYKDILTSIVKAYHKALVSVGEPTEEEIEAWGNKIKSVNDWVFMHSSFAYGKCKLDIEIIDDFDILSNHLATEARNILRDING
jgi:hypothetical protein